MDTVWELQCSQYSTLRQSPRVNFWELMVLNRDISQVTCPFDYSTNIVKSGQTAWYNLKRCWTLHINYIFSLKWLSTSDVFRNWVFKFLWGSSIIFCWSPQWHCLWQSCPLWFLSLSYAGHHTAQQRNRHSILHLISWIIDRSAIDQYCNMPQTAVQVNYTVLFNVI